jgi:hypothetical protein
MGRLYKMVPTVAAISAAATNKNLVIITPAANKLVLIRSITISQRGNNDNETWSCALREIATPAAGDAFTNIEPVDPGDPAASFAVAADNGTTITGTSGNYLAKVGGHVQGPLQMVPTDDKGVLMIASANRVALIQCDNAPASSATTPIIEILCEEIGA